MRIDISEWLRRIDKECCVYRYTDLNDGIIKYVGIVCDGAASNRHIAHTKESWYQDGDFLVEYIIVSNRSEAEAIESHLISLYETDRYFNKAKSNWGLNSFLPTIYDWKPVIITINDLISNLQTTCNYYEDKQNGQIHISRIRDYINEFHYIQRVNEFLNKNKICCNN